MKKVLIIVSSVIGILLLSIFLFFVYLKLRYDSWEKEFVSNQNSEYLISKDSEIDIKSKLAQFTLSYSDSEFLRLDVREVGILLFSTLQKYIGEEAELKYIYIEPADSKWIIYSNLGYKGAYIWVSLDLNKDSMQTAQLYSTNVSVGPFSIGNLSNVVESINKGIGEAVVTVNENGFVGRYLENIELLDDSVVIKGSRY
ncbi:MAG: hypothetical protein UR34_C0007G0011 [candidate division WS6 bacterium GW2011_GWC1_33_20]|uniref:Uncharacterized protein n=2 Tax=Candidatus Dojkabacteria TaxID=74243 RepID=A0A0G0CW55_9BACT|nr:MAG: hypothetical protein UR32_C0018G0007 [candidate division WS6 bacterium GW2011_GWE2_33_157]KKP44019.1 MAG: hypothetical protein UR34_C0007G0011 [candidate division WS6 bacterium GW2011_GWC1_33_20]KKP44243.1 MAG: hypothetical protein UR36_C0019G0007 [candidate division WS6 bacterium GW2011_GWF1_33_233]KKP54593.1 MAG: hypothetical protein UR45_C0011G0007 [candidate division WS6 bacterium GW2011_WS6_33_547]KKP55290.1 MAG: hypothetical protein UR47_C0002G0007 [candidate division WS6 bacteriu